MNSWPEPAIRIAVDPTNPGQIFACCGLLELADRLYDGAEGWFESGRFNVRSVVTCSLSELLQTFKTTSLKGEADEGIAGETGSDTEDEADEDNKVQPLELALPPASRSLRLDWWADRSLKPWAGSMNVRVIFRAMANGIDPFNPDPLNDQCVVFDPVPETPSRTGSARPRGGKKREPFYFDARRGASARSLDIGFAPDALNMTTTAFPALESLCLVGLQRFRPLPTGTPRVFEYCTWSIPLEPIVASTAVCGELPHVTSRTFRFENAFRTDQRKHKAFTPAEAIARSAL